MGTGSGIIPIYPRPVRSWLLLPRRHGLEVNSPQAGLVVVRGDGDQPSRIGDQVVALVQDEILVLTPAGARKRYGFPAGSSIPVRLRIGEPPAPQSVQLARGAGRPTPSSFPLPPIRSFCYEYDYGMILPRSLA